MSPMDEISIEACGKVTSKTHIYKALTVDNMPTSWDKGVCGEMSNSGEMGVGVNLPEEG